MTTSSAQKSTLGYFTWAFIVTALGLILGAWLGWQTTGTLSGMLSVFFICCVLAVLEISLSFDNAIVNANKLKDMTPVWQQRFLTWGIAIAVFGMRIVFPLVIVMVAASLGPIEAMKLALNEPTEYQRIVSEAHIGLMGFGGAFLGMVGLKYFFDSDKEVDWIAAIERPLAKVADIDAVFRHVRDDKGRFSMGGMASKLEAVKFAVDAGIETHIAHGRHPERLADIVAGKGISTRFHAAG